ncbi:MAG: AMP-binding protein [Flavobacteriales bacterium]|nr:AMP-binding protein [Flavobacteriales bacterium]
MKTLHSEIKSGEIVKNISTLLVENASKFGNKIVFQEKVDGIYKGISWDKFLSEIKNIASNLIDLGFEKGEKMIIYSPNRLEMLELELAVMSIGGVAVPIFAYFKEDTAKLLMEHSDATYLAVAEQLQLDRTDHNLPFKKVIHFDDVKDDKFNNLISFKNLLSANKNEVLDLDISPDDICLNMYTSGTMGTPKCVQLSHKNILSQQAAIKEILKVNQEDKFLSYLPWHHSFGGIFELFSALYNGATYSVESSFGKDVKVIIENWKEIKPTVFFSVPKVYQNLVELCNQDEDTKQLFFNSGLKFIFTAAASLPINLSNLFQEKGITVVEGWGLTETSPCCTLTNPDLERQTGVVGVPIPGVSLRIAEDDEIQVKGPNVMKEYYKNEEANKDIFTEDGWYKTGDVGSITSSGLKLISRKDRIFKLSNGEKVIPTDLEKIIEKKCHYVQYVIVSGTGNDYPVALIFPNQNLLKNPDYQKSPEDGCFCPRNINEFGRCLQGCLKQSNDELKQKFAKIKKAVVLDSSLSLEDNTLTPSMKMAPKNVLEKYKSYYLNMYGEQLSTEDNLYIIDLEDE